MRLKNLKRIHLTEWLVITFEVSLQKNFILFIILYQEIIFIRNFRKKLKS
jgi:uncharacterized membrane protein